MATDGPTRRAIRLIDALVQGSTLSVNEAREVTGVEVARTRQMIDTLVEEADWAEYAPGAPRRVRLVGIRRVEVSEEVAIAACFAATLAPLFEGTNLENGMRNILRYLVDASEQPEKYRDLERKFFFVRRGGEVALPSRAKALERIVRAILDTRYVRLTFIKFGAEKETTTDTFAPLSIGIHDHQLYVLARRASDSPIRLIRFSRITDVRRVNKGFEYPSELEFSPRQLFAPAFGVFLRDARTPTEVVTLRLDPRWTAYAQTHRWHASQLVEERADGVYVQLTVQPSPELASWILGFGGDAEVVTPESLRQEIAAQAKRLARLYSEQ